MKLEAIKTVLAAYRSTEAHITQAQIEAAWAEHALAERVLTRPWWSRVACWLRGHRFGVYANPQRTCVDCGKAFGFEQEAGKP